MLRCFYRVRFPTLRLQEPSLPHYLAAMDATLSTLRASSPGTRVAVLTLPPVGEDLDDDVNARVAQYNTALQELVAKYSDSECTAVL